MTEITEVEFEPYFGSFILETLTLGMYGESKNAIREYVQNSYDSLIASIAEGAISKADARIDIVMDPVKNSVSIRDNGSGIRKSKAVETLTNIGASSKDFKNQAGFRGIGRLSALVLCDSLIFTTKAAGEAVETIVTFNAKGMRHDLSPTRARLLSMSEILLKHVTAKVRTVKKSDEPFFEVLMKDLHEAPIECTNFSEMVGFLGEVAPVPYSSDFVAASRIKSMARSLKQPLEEVNIFVHDGSDDEEGTQVLKHYGALYPVQSVKVPLSDVEIIESPTGLWWGWVGKKEKSGFYKNERLKGIRVRSRNIQIDGTQIMGKIFGDIDNAASYLRFNEWFVGEIFAHSEYLVPNARRDGFEELESWIVARSELSDICKELGKSAYALSQKSQSDLTELVRQADKLSKQASELIPENIKEISKVIAEIDKIQRKVNRAAKSSDNEVAGQLRTIESRLLHSHKKALSKISSATFVSSPEVIAAAQRAIVQQLIAAFDDEFDRPSFSRIMKVIERVVGDIE
jgi:molecular chaperone HtpG